MANEYLKRTPTSTGNRKVFTWSGWIKKEAQSTNATIFEATLSGEYRRNFLTLYNGALYYGAEDPSATTVILVGSDALFRDNNSWYHIIWSIDTTALQLQDRVRIYVNGVQARLNFTTTTNLSINTQQAINGTGEHNIGKIPVLSNTEQFSGYLADVFLVDGQALTPDVFGFYKEGKGYISAGSTQSTDFRPGQWVPKSPRIIKTEINRRGGFGVNGFYLPMNDSSNFGADFHCEPNSIITLKGEDLPQPRNGAPTTTYAYVSQLRTDPYAANLVLAVPGISTATGANLITNGTFEDGTNNWTVINSSATLSVDSLGRLQVDRSGTNLNAYQYIDTEIGKRYTVSANLTSGTGGNAQLRAYENDLTTSIQVISKGDGETHSFSFTAVGTQTAIILSVDNNGGNAFFDNIVVKQEDAPRDYSADIKGSGSNKTLTPNGGAGVGYEIPSYYGSALSFDGTGDYLSRTYDADFNFGTSDFAVEMWVYPNTVNSIDGLFAVSGGSGGNPKMAFHLNNGTPSVHYNNLTGAADIYTASSTTIPAGQWSHLAYERKGSTWTWYINGVATGTGSNSTDITFTSQPMYIGYGGEAYFDSLDGKIQDLRVYKGVAKYKGGFDVPKPYTPVGIATWRAVPDTTANNFITMSPLSVVNSSGGGLNLSLSDGNLTVATDGTANQVARGSFIVSSGKWYFETTLPSATGLTSQNSGVGVVAPNIGGVDGSSGSGYAILYREAGGAFLGNAVSRSDPAAGTHATYVAGDIIGVALDIDNGDVEFFKNGVSAATYNFPTHAVSGTNWTIESLARQADSVVVHNFGQNPTFSGNTTAGTYTDSNGKGLFKYQPPSGFLALCSDNLPEPVISDPGEHFKTVLWTGDDSNARGIVGVGFKPDLVWIKQRDTSNENHQLQDSIRGATNRLFSNLNVVESPDTNSLRSFDNDGFSVGTSDNYNGPNRGYVAWCWKAGGEAVTNTDGTITSQVSVNQDAGFSIVSWTGNNEATATVGHGLGKVPAFVILKARDTTGENNWVIFHKSMGSSTFDKYMFFNTGPVGTLVPSLPANSNIFTVCNPSINSSNIRYITYCWAEIEGYSKFGSYVGNGNADGPFVYCGFKPAFVLIKASSTSGDWLIMDSSRNSTNPLSFDVYANLSNVETDFDRLDFLSNGFKNRATYSNNNANGVTYIFAAFAESPFQTANSK